MGRDLQVAERGLFMRSPDTCKKLEQLQYLYRILGEGLAIKGKTRVRNEPRTLVSEVLRKMSFRSFRGRLPK
jgi:hypothetical protein